MRQRLWVCECEQLSPLSAHVRTEFQVQVFLPPAIPPEFIDRAGHLFRLTFLPIYPTLLAHTPTCPQAHSFPSRPSVKIREAYQ